MHSGINGGRSSLCIPSTEISPITSMHKVCSPQPLPAPKPHCLPILRVSRNLELFHGRAWQEKELWLRNWIKSRWLLRSKTDVFLTAFQKQKNYIWWSEEYKQIRSGLILLNWPQKLAPLPPLGTDNSFHITIFSSEVIVLMLFWELSLNTLVYYSFASLCFIIW